MSDNTLQYEWMVKLRENLERHAEYFVAANLFWYPVEGEPRTVLAPDVFVALGRPKGHRRSYKQWEEDGVAPQIVFEVMSESNSWPEMMRKMAFYSKHGAQEFYVLDPDHGKWFGWLLEPGADVQVLHMDGWVSPLLGVRFEDGGAVAAIYGPDGSPFVTPAELHTEMEAAKQRAEQEKQRAEQEKQRAEQEKQRAEQEKQRAERLAARLRSLGIDPDE